MSVSKNFRRSVFLAAAVALAAPFGASAQKAPDYAAIVAAPDRSDADRTIDKRRNPTQLFAFTGARPGMTVLDMGAGGGYSTELLARIVSPGGKVYAQNAPTFGGRWQATLGRAGRLDRDETGDAAVASVRRPDAAGGA